MKIPLLAERLVKDGEQYLSIWANGNNYIVKPPINPYFYSKSLINVRALKVTKVTGILKSTLQVGTVYKYEFRNVEEIRKYRNEATFEDNIKFVNRIAIDFPDFFLKYPHTNQLTYFNIDIEQANESGGYFPSINDPLISIGFAVNGEKIRVIAGDEEKILKKFCEVVAWYKTKYPSFPDIIYGYNLVDYDIPVLFNKLKEYDLLDVFEKCNEKPVINKKKVRLAGVGIFDIFYHVRKDQSLLGEVRDYSLKTIARYFGIPIYDLPDKDMQKYIGTRDLIKYNASDVNANRELFKKYYPIVRYIAEKLKVPLANCFEYDASFLAEIIYGRIFKENNMISDGKNQQLYPEVYSSRPYYEGALVDIKRKGLFSPVYKADFSSMYPTIMVSFNLSPDTTSIVDFLPYNPDGFAMKERGNALYIEIPDKNILPNGRNVIVKVLKKQGAVTKLILEDMEERKKYKQQLKQLKAKEEKGIPLTEEEKKLKKTLEVKSWGIKVIMNSGYYGTLGNATHPYGHLGIALTVTGIARQIISILLEMDGNTFDLIEWDTDGIYLHPHKDFDEKQVLAQFYEILDEKFPSLAYKPKLDFEKYKAGYFRKKKNYLLLTQSGEIIKHGNSLKNKKFAPLTQEYIDTVARPLLENDMEDAKEITKQYLKVEDFPLEKLAMQTTLGTPFEKISKSALSYRLALQGLRIGIKPLVGQHYRYIKTRNGYKLLEITKKHEVDYEYYRKQITKTAEALGLVANGYKDVMSYM